MAVAQLREHYPELNDLPLVEPHIIDDGETLETIEDHSLDFIIANHMLEHCENPIGTLRNHFSKLKAGGFAYYAIPNKHFTFDRDRPITDFQHIMMDELNGPAGSREQHYREVATITEWKRGEEAVRRVQSLMERNYSIHFHVWDYNAFYEFILRANGYLGNCYTPLVFLRNPAKEEVICILQNAPDHELDKKLMELKKRTPSSKSLSGLWQHEAEIIKGYASYVALAGLNKIAHSPLKPLLKTSFGRNIKHFTKSTLRVVGVVR
jgi:predicted SAM-dependent methyltransferase